MRKGAGRGASTMRGGWEPASVLWGHEDSAMSDPTAGSRGPGEDTAARFRRQQAALLELTRRGPGPGELRHILEVAAGALGVERVGVWRYTPDRQALTCAALF